jgi:hypothetical protein
MPVEAQYLFETEKRMEIVLIENRHEDTAFAGTVMLYICVALKSVCLSIGRKGYERSPSIQNTSWG